MAENSSHASLWKQLANKISIHICNLVKFEHNPKKTKKSHKKPFPAKNFIEQQHTPCQNNTQLNKCPEISHQCSGDKTNLWNCEPQNLWNLEKWLFLLKPHTVTFTWIFVKHRLYPPIIAFQVPFLAVSCVFVPSDSSLPINRWIEWQFTRFLVFVAKCRSRDPNYCLSVVIWVLKLYLSACFSTLPQFLMQWARIVLYVSSFPSLFRVIAWTCLRLVLNLLVRLASAGHRLICLLFVLFSLVLRRLFDFRKTDCQL